MCCRTNDLSRDGPYILSGRSSGRISGIRWKNWPDSRISFQHNYLIIKVGGSSPELGGLRFFINFKKFKEKLN